MENHWERITVVFGLFKWMCTLKPSQALYEMSYGSVRMMIAVIWKIRLSNLNEKQSIQT